MVQKCIILCYLLQFLPGSNNYINTFYTLLEKGGFFQNFLMQLINFVLRDIFNFQILNNKIVLVTNCFLNKIRK